jgi:uncharacterized protein YbjT (DUF2867 family)
MSTYAITGATGNTGKVIAAKLLEDGHKVRAIGRSSERLAGLVEKGAEPHVGSIDDENFLTEAFKGADAVYAMIPPDFTVEKFRPYQNKMGEHLANAIEKARVKRVVFLSSIAAHLSDKTGPIAGLHDVEERLNKLQGVDMLHLRPTFFMENLFAGIGTIKSMGVNGSATQGDIPIAMIATQDVGDYAARRLSKLDFSGQSTQELLGPRDITMQEATKILGKAIGKDDLQYVQFSYEDTEKAVQGLGFTPDGARTYVDLAKGLNEGIVKGLEERNQENTTPTTLEDMGKFFSMAYNAI